MGATDTDVIAVPTLKGTLDDFSMTAANWWVKHLVIDGIRYRNRLHAEDPTVEAVRNALSDEIRKRMVVEEDGHVWLITHYSDETFPLFDRVLREQGLRNAHWPIGVAMWLSFRQQVARIEVRRRRRRRHGPSVRNKVIYERFIGERSDD